MSSAISDPDQISTSNENDASSEKSRSITHHSPLSVLKDDRSRPVFETFGLTTTMIPVHDIPVIMHVPSGCIIIPFGAI
jgi:hypothetical protein